MTRWDVVKIFTVEGSTYSILAAGLAALYGTPLFYYMSKNGYTMPQSGTDMGISVADVIYPTYGIGLIISTIVIVVLASTIVSFLPARKIAKLKPTDALKGKIQ
jgi:ABC-type antimicrobial peptide transport system permease subunit